MKASSKLLLALSLTMALMLADEGSAQTSGPIYIVESGDTLSAIALKFGTTVDALAATNNLNDISTLFPGQELIIPGFEGIQGVLITREVGFGDTLHSLSLRYGVEPEDLSLLNRMIHPGRLYVGQAMILVNSPPSGKMLSEARTILISPGQSLLEFAARYGRNPWTLALSNQKVGRTWLVPGETIFIGADGIPTSALPDPMVGVLAEPLPLTQGRTAIIRVGLSSPAWAEGRIGEWDLHFHQEDSLELVALQGINALIEPGLYDLQIDLYASEGGALTYSHTQPVRLRSGDYGFDPVLTVPEDTLDPENVEPEETFFASIVGADTPDRLWEDSFSFPTTYYTDSFPSVFGTRRNYNNLGYRFYHTGLDFYGGTGVAILAPARGRVAFAGPLKVRGNTTILDHGWGVFTVYMHQSEIFVEEGDLVRVGETIGSVGATGRVTGPHLHWEVRVGGIPVNPIEWVEGTFP